MGKHLLLLGGGHAHMTVMRDMQRFVQRGHRVSLVGPDVHHYYSGMGPGMLGGTYAPEEIRFPVAEMVESGGGTFIQDKAASIDPQAGKVSLESGREVEYDVLSCNVGSGVPDAMVRGESQKVIPVKPIANLVEARQRLQAESLRSRLSIAVIGGGAASLEIAGNVWRAARQGGGHMPHIRIYAGRSFLSGKPERVRKLARASLRQRGIEVHESGYVSEIRGGSISLESGVAGAADLIFLAVGVKPPSLFADSNLPVGADGGLLVNSFLHSPAHPEIFGGGDCIYYQDQGLDKVGVYAVRQNPVLAHNLLAALEGGALQRFSPGKSYLLIYNLGNDQGLFWKGRLIFKGRIAFRIKDHIDRKFMRNFSPQRA